MIIMNFMHKQAAIHAAWLGTSYSSSSFPEYRTVFYCGLLFALVALVGCLVVESPYGKLQANGLIPASLSLNPRFGWFLMELPATLSFTYFYFTSPNKWNPVSLFFACLWYLHYGNRGFYFPFTIRVSSGSKANFSLLVILAGWMFTSLHGYLSANWYGRVGQHLDSSWLMEPQFIVGFIGYQLSFWITIHSEHIQRNLRSLKPKVDEPRYKIPRGGMFDYITNPTYFFELTGWFFFALMTSNPGGLLVFVVSCINLIPRAFQQHNWYLKTFGSEYPKERKVLVPFAL
jgi:3-oxo-5-alpha-steroid 4-dehydrogenase 1